MVARPLGGLPKAPHERATYLKARCVIFVLLPYEADRNIATQMEAGKAHNPPTPGLGKGARLANDHFRCCACSACLTYFFRLNEAQDFPPKVVLFTSVEVMWGIYSSLRVNVLERVGLGCGTIRGVLIVQRCLSPTLRGLKWRDVESLL